MQRVIYHCQGKNEYGEWIEIGPSFDYSYQADAWLESYKHSSSNEGQYQKYRIKAYFI